jgi:serine phosphatase RsbU (regulator of sigma subunit)
MDDGETLVMFTDGVTEARSATDEEFGEEWLMACLIAAPESSPRVLPNRIFAAIPEFCQQADQSDDMTVTVTRFVDSVLSG